MRTVTQQLSRPFRGELPRQPSPRGLLNAFDRVVAINLPRRVDRFSSLLESLDGNWPFAMPQRFEAIDGSQLTPPSTWEHGPGAWGCQQSHRAVLDSAIADGVNSLLVLEDDACPVTDLARKAERFFGQIHGDWDCLMLGAQHLSPPTAVVPGVVRCTISIRCHAYAVRGAFMPMLSAFWSCNQTDHCDLVLASLMGNFKAYAPDPLLIGQSAGHSDITGKAYQTRFMPGSI